MATFGFTGEVQDGGNVYLRARWYNASAGRFTSVDPFEGFPQQPYSLHQYQYGYSAPFTQVLATITTRYTQDLASPLSQVLNSGGANYIYGAERLFASTSGTRTWYGSDALGSVRQTLSNTGVVQGAINYDPWGAVQSGSVATFGFTGEVQDGSNVYLRARWYNASAGRFVGVDPWEGNAQRPLSLHKYAYSENDPANAIDPTGWETFRIWTAAFIRPKSLDFFGAEWHGDNRDFYDFTGPIPSSRIWAQVTIDTDAADGIVPGSVEHRVGETQSTTTDWQGRRITERKTASDEAQVRWARDRNYIIVSIQNSGTNPLSPPGSPAIKYDYDIVFDIDKERVIVVGSTSLFPSHEIRIGNIGERTYDPDYAGGANPLSLYLPGQNFAPSAVPIKVSQPKICVRPNWEAWHSIDPMNLRWMVPLFSDGLPWVTAGE